MSFESRKDALVWYQRTADQLCEKWGVPKVPVEFKGFYTYAYSRANKDHIIGLYILPKHAYEERLILLSPLGYDTWGFSRMMGTLRHEVAHHIAYYLYGDNGDPHGEPFLTICKKVGGTLGGGTFENLSYDNQERYKELKGG